MKRRQVRIELVVVAVLSLGLAAASALAGQPQERFNVWLKRLDKSFSAGSADEIARALLLDSQTRIATFYLQGLGKLYDAQNPTFKELRKGFKKIEDRIGQYDKWETLADEAKKEAWRAKRAGNLAQYRESLEEADRHRASQEQERLALIEAIKKDPALTRTYLKFIRDYRFKDESGDQEEVLASLAGQLQSVLDTQFDFSLLEEGAENPKRSSLHEYRREVRWFTIEARSLNGLVRLLPIPENKKCSITEYSYLLERGTINKYSDLPANNNESNPCFVEACLFLAAGEVVGQIGALKDQSERENNRTSPPSNLVTDEFREPAQKIFDQVKKTRLLEKLRDQIQACIPARG